MNPFTCHCPACRDTYNRNQRRLTLALSTILLGLVWVLVEMVKKN